ncbi:MAG: lysophospholipase L1-like esterase [Pseudohongiellaceae bacterium]|jgi:lysophospholipase L1-like esterase
MFALSLSGLLLAAAFAEGGLRLFAPVGYRAPRESIKGDAWFGMLNQPSPVEGLAYELAADARWMLWDDVPVLTNSLGMRDDEPRGGGGDAVRIAVLGDSVTFGVGVPARTTYASVLEQKLESGRESGARPFEVLNFGVSGYSSRDEALVLEHKALPLGPDLVVIGYVFNDPEIDPIQPLHAHFHEPEWWQSSHLLRLLAKRSNRRAINDLGGGNYMRYLHHDPRKWGSVLQAFDDIAALSADFPVVLVIFPSIPGSADADWTDYDFGDLHERVGVAARAAGFGVVDLAEAFSLHPPESLRVSATDGHPSVSGHTLAAETLAAFLLADPERWLP